jgi:hypothetical protein
MHSILPVGPVKHGMPVSHHPTAHTHVECRGSQRHCASNQACSSSQRNTTSVQQVQGMAHEPKSPQHLYSWQDYRNPMQLTHRKPCSCDQPLKQTGACLQASSAAAGVSQLVTMTGVKRQSLLQVDNKPTEVGGLSTRPKCVQQQCDARLPGSIPASHMW